MTDVRSTLQNIEEEQKHLAQKRAEIQELEKLRSVKESLSKEITELKGRDFVLRKEAEDETDDIHKHEILLEAAHVRKCLKERMVQMKDIEIKLSHMDYPDEVTRNFDKYR